MHENAAFYILQTGKSTASIGYDKTSWRRVYAPVQVVMETIHVINYLLNDNPSVACYTPCFKFGVTILLTSMSTRRGRFFRITRFHYGVLAFM